MVDKGTIRVAGRDITRWSENRRARLIGRVFQNPFTGTAPTMSIAENLALALRRGRPRGLAWALSPGLKSELRAIECDRWDWAWKIGWTMPSAASRAASGNR